MISPEELQRMQETIKGLREEVLAWRNRGLGGDPDLHALQSALQSAIRVLDSIRSI